MEIKGKYWKTRRKKVILNSFLYFWKSDNRALTIILKKIILFSFLWLFDPSLVHGVFFRGFVNTLRHTTLSMNPLDERSARHRYRSLTTYKITRYRRPCFRRDSNPHSQQTRGCRPTHKILFSVFFTTVCMWLWLTATVFKLRHAWIMWWMYVMMQYCKSTNAVATVNGLLQFTVATVSNQRR